MVYNINCLMLGGQLSEHSCLPGAENPLVVDLDSLTVLVAPLSRTHIEADGIKVDLGTPPKLDIAGFQQPFPHDRIR